MRHLTFAALLALFACDYNPNAKPQPPAHDGPLFYLHGFPIYTVVYGGNHCFLIDFHDPQFPGVDGFENRDRYMFACSGH